MIFKGKQVFAICKNCATQSSTISFLFDFKADLVNIKILVKKWKEGSQVAV